MTDQTPNTEQKIQEACEVARSQQNPNLAQIARDHRVNYQNFRHRYLGMTSKQTRSGSNKRLDPTQENSFLLYIRNLEAVGGSMTMERLASAANLILSKVADASQDPPVPISESWVGRFLARHPELKTVKQKPLEVSRALAQQPRKVEEYFERLQGEMIKYGIAECDLWNMDEAGFRIGMGGNRTIIPFAPTRKKSIISPAKWTVNR